MAVNATITNIQTTGDWRSVKVYVTYSDGLHSADTVFDVTPDMSSAQVQKLIVDAGGQYVNQFAIQTKYDTAVAGGKTPYSQFIGAVIPVG